jgi:hypothetical protein
MRRIVASLKGLPTICIASGSPLRSNPVQMEIAGLPVTLKTAVKFGRWKK